MMEEKKLFFSIPGAPKGKGRPRMMRTGHTYTPPGTAAYENLVRLSFARTYPNHTPISGRVMAEISIYYPIPKSWPKKRWELWKAGEVFPLVKPDIDNVVKAVLDSLNNIAFTDDSHVTDAAIKKRYSEIPRVDVMLTYWIEEESA